MVVKSELEKLGLQLLAVDLGEVETAAPITAQQKSKIAEYLKGFGFELIDDKKSRLIEKIKTLIIGDDLVNHERVENIVKLLAIFKKYSDFNLVVLNEELEKKIDSCTNFDLEEIKDLKSFNGTLVYKLTEKNSEELLVSQTFANIAKVSNTNEVFIISKDEKIKKILKIDENLHGTIAILKTDEDIFSSYKYKQVKIEKVEA